MPLATNFSFKVIQNLLRRHLDSGLSQTFMNISANFTSTAVWVQTLLPERSSCQPQSLAGILLMELRATFHQTMTNSTCNISIDQETFQKSTKLLFTL